VDKSIALILVYISEVAVIIFHITTSSAVPFGLWKKTLRSRRDTHEGYETKVHQNLKIRNLVKCHFLYLSSSYE